MPIYCRGDLGLLQNVQDFINTVGITCDQMLGSDQFSFEKHSIFD
jgi:hypothetical protein